MKNTKTAPAPAAEPKPAAPAFAPQTAKIVPPQRHEKTARTVCHVQMDGEKTHLFSYAGDYIATVSAEEGKRYLPPERPAPKAEPEAPASAT